MYILSRFGGSFLIENFYFQVAQQVEQLAVNQRVAGSNPVLGVKA